MENIQKNFGDTEALTGVSLAVAAVNDPAVLLRGTSYDAAERPILYSSEYINTNVIRFNQIRKRQTEVT